MSSEQHRSKVHRSLARSPPTAAGLNTSLVPMYISEIAPLNLRGGLGTVNQLAVTVGLLLSQVLGIEQILGTNEGWPILLGLAICPAILQLILLPVCPESPRYLLITKQWEEEARKGKSISYCFPGLVNHWDKLVACSTASSARLRLSGWGHWGDARRGARSAGREPYIDHGAHLFAHIASAIDHWHCDAAEPTV